MDLMDGFVNNDKFIWCIDNFRKSYCIKMNIAKVRNCFLQEKIWKFDSKETTWNINYRNKFICLIIGTLKVLNYKKKCFMLQSSNHKINNLI